MLYLTYLLIGILAGVFSGLLGIGGGIIIVPALSLLFQYNHLFTNGISMHMAIGSSLAIMIFTALSVGYAYHRRRLIAWPIFFRFVPGLSIGIISGAVTANYLSSKSLRVLFSLFLIGTAIHLCFEKSKITTKESVIHRTFTPSIILLTIVAFSIGLLSGLFGIGGGILMIPFFLFLGLSMNKAAGTSSICSIPIAVIGTISVLFTGWLATKDYAHLTGITGYIYWPAVALISSTSIIFAPIGTHLAVLLPNLILKRIFAFILIISACNLIILSF